MPTLNFKGKTFVQNHHLAVKYHQLVPKSELSLTDTVSLHDNLILHGDNLKALKALLPNYAGKVKCIYIDPPYNTGNENWVYNDNVSSPMIKEWLGSVVDREDLTRHDKWLCMMTPRLKLLRELLSEDGAIFISCDDNEQHNLRCLLDEIFGEDRFVSSSILITNRGGRDYGGIAIQHEYVLIYSKTDEFGLNLIEEKNKKFQYEDEIGGFNLMELRNRNIKFNENNRPNLVYPFYVNPNNPDKNGLLEISLEDKEGFIKVLPTKSQGVQTVWRWGKEEKSRHNLNKEIFGKINQNGGYMIVQKYRKTVKMQRSVWDEKEFVNERGTETLKEIFEKNYFDYPKSVFTIKRILELATDKDSIVLDSFAGSGTTAHAVLELNKEDGGNRQFILVEQEDYANTITAERVRRVINGVETARNETLKNGTGGTFSYFELGAAIEMEAILTQNTLPSYLEFARYLFYTATGEQFNEKVMNEETGFIGESRNYEVYLFYQPDIEWLKQNALTLDRCRSFPKNKSKKHLVFAPAKYVDDDTCDEHRIVFCQLPYEIYRLNH